jgi:citrate lyase subunit alpha/citrate CoA-transferase
VITERGIAINPKRADLLDKLRGSDLPIEPIEQIKEEVEALVGGPPEPPNDTDKPVAVVKWVEGTVIDTVWQVVE